MYPVIGFSASCSCVIWLIPMNIRANSPAERSRCSLVISCSARILCLSALSSFCYLKTSSRSWFCFFPDSVHGSSPYLSCMGMFLTSERSSSWSLMLACFVLNIYCTCSCCASISFWRSTIFLINIATLPSLGRSSSLVSSVMFSKVA